MNNWKVFNHLTPSFLASVIAIRLYCQVIKNIRRWINFDIVFSLFGNFKIKLAVLLGAFNKFLLWMNRTQIFLVRAESELRFSPEYGTEPELYASEPQFLLVRTPYPNFFSHNKIINFTIFLNIFLMASLKIVDISFTPTWCDF